MAAKHGPHIQTQCLSSTLSHFSIDEQHLAGPHYKKKTILAQAGKSGMLALLTKGASVGLFVSCMQDGWIPKDVLYGELAFGSRPEPR